jgi:hypothetical protein
MDLLDLISNKDAFISALNANPNIINQQDNDEMTVLHHAGTLGKIMGSNSISQIFEVLFDESMCPNLDFTLKDAHGNTPLDIAAMCCHERVTCNYVFPTFVNEADQRGVDFSTLNPRLFEVAINTSYYGKSSTIRKFLKQFTNKYIVQQLMELNINILDQFLNNYEASLIDLKQGNTELIFVDE